MRTVHSLEELLLLPGDQCVNGFRARSEIRLEIPDITRATLIRAQESLNALQQSGGAIAASALMLCALVIGAVEVGQRFSSMTSLRALMGLAAVLACSFALGFAARYGARVFTRWRFTRLCREQHRALSGELMRPVATRTDDC